ncbi:MAG: ABC transporter substrate-binding protein [Pseudomonadota bacterium]
MTALTRLTASALAIAVGLTAAHAQDVAREDTVIFDLDRTIKDPENFNWFTPGTKRMHGAHQTMWEPLFILNYSTGELEPWLGTAIEANADFTEWTLTLRDGIEWSDGEAFNADDVVFTVEMALGSEELSSREAATVRAQVASVTQVDDLTVTFALNEANPRFAVENFGVRIFGSFLIMPEHVWASEDAATFAFNPPIGTGPYTFTSATTSRAIWDRNDAWWGAKSGFMELPAPARVVFLETGGEESRAQLIAANQLDAAQNVTVGTFEAVQAQNPAVIAWHDGYPYAAADPCARQLEINTTVAPWDDPAMRRAVAQIIDRTQIVNVAYEGTTIPSRTMFADYGSMAPFIDAVMEAGAGLPASADVGAAKALIEGAGWTMGGDGIYQKDGAALEVAIHVNSASTEYTRTIDVVVEQLNRAGIAARSVPVENGVFWGEILPFGAYEMSYSWLSCGSVNEPWSSMGRYTVADVVPVGERSPGFNNTARWDSEGAAAYSDLVAQMAALAPTDPALPGLTAEAHSLLTEEAPFIPLVQAAKLLPFNTTYWTGWPTAENDYNHPFFWWNHTHQIIHSLEKAGG